MSVDNLLPYILLKKIMVSVTLRDEEENRLAPFGNISYFLVPDYFI
jgi:hypothetical protein